MKKAGFRRFASNRRFGNAVRDKFEDALGHCGGLHAQFGDCPALPEGRLAKRAHDEQAGDLAAVGVEGVAFGGRFDSV